MSDPCINCGQGVTCTCLVGGEGLVNIYGDGSEDNEFIVEVACEDVVACIADMLDDVGFSLGDGAFVAGGDALAVLTANGDGTADWVTPPSNLTGPYLLFDTRTWAGGATLPNTGSAGSYYDLTIASYTTHGLAAQYGINTQSSISLTPWSALGGDPNTAPFTAVFAVNARPQNIGSPATYDTYVEMDMMFSRLVGHRNPRWLMDLVQFQNGDIQLEHIWGPTTIGTYSDTTWDGGSPDLATKVVVIALDMMGGQADIWINGFAQYGLGNVIRDFGITNPAAATLLDMFLYMGDNVPAVSSGEWTNGPKAMAFYRGYPLDSDIAMLQALYG